MAAIVFFFTLDTSEDAMHGATQPPRMRIQSTQIRNLPPASIEDTSPNVYYDDDADKDSSISGRLAIFVQTEGPSFDIRLTDDSFTLNEHYVSTIAEGSPRFATTTKSSTVPMIEPGFNVNMEETTEEVKSKQHDDYPNNVEHATGKSTRLFPADWQNFPFTSGHQNSFGIPIEEDERLLHMIAEQSAQSDLSDRQGHVSTTAANVNSATRVSPTLPNLHHPTDSHSLRPTQEGRFLVIVYA